MIMALSYDLHDIIDPYLDAPDNVDTVEFAVISCAAGTCPPNDGIAALKFKKFEGFR